ncbi:MAG TPA: mannose-1-phosphate guanylyltransferase [Microlunatus sp.]
MRYVVIVAGGSGTRLWPLSRQGTPKQLLNLVNGKTLLRIAYERIQGLVPDERVLVCTGADFRDAVAEEIPELPAENILGEPIGRDTLNAVAYPAAVLARRDPDAVMASVTSDQVMNPVSTLRAALQKAFKVAESHADSLITFGVVPTAPHTGFGYLERGSAIAGHTGVCQLASFTEKPDRETAERYLASGRYWWNSGMFVWRCATFLDQLRQLRPDTYDILATLTADPSRLGELYPQLPKISVDYAVMEPVSRGEGTAQVLAVRLPITWHDVGGFEALGSQLPRDSDGNATTGQSVLVDSSDNVVINQDEDGRVVAVVGLSGTVIVQTPEITLVCPITQAERIKELVNEVTQRLGTSYA